jgi:hypothetical protein
MSAKCGQGSEDGRFENLTNTQWRESYPALRF